MSVHVYRGSIAFYGGNLIKAEIDVTENWNERCTLSLKFTRFLSGPHVGLHLHVESTIDIDNNYSMSGRWERKTFE